MILNFRASIMPKRTPYVMMLTCSVVRLDLNHFSAKISLCKSRLNAGKNVPRNGGDATVVLGTDFRSPVFGSTADGSHPERDREG
jgi:hypothetical protein